MRPPETYDPPADGLAHGLKPLRLRLGYTQRQMATLAQLGTSQLGRIERLREKIPFRAAVRISRICDIPVASLYAAPSGYLTDKP